MLYGGIYLELGLIIVLALTLARILKKFGVPSVLGLVLGGLAINIIFQISQTVTETDYYSLKVIVTELALAYIGFDIGNEIDLNLMREKGTKLGGVLIGQAFGAFLLGGLIVYLVTGNFIVALILGAIAVTTAPAATSLILAEYQAKGELSQTILFIIAFDDILAILIVNLAITLSLSTGISFSIFISAFQILIIEIIVALVFAILGALLIWFSVKYGLLTSKIQAVETLLAMSLIIIGGNLLYGGSVILSMFVFGMILKTLEHRDTENYDALDDIVLNLEYLSLPVIILFFILVGLEMNLTLIFAENGYIFILALLFFLGRAFGKAFGTWITAFNLSSKVRKNLPLTLITQAGIAIGLAGLAYNKLIEVSLFYEANLIINVVGVSVIFAEIIGPLLVKRAILNSGEAQVANN